MSTTKIEILDCPFCRQNSFSIENVGDEDDGDDLLFVVCQNCGSSGPHAVNHISAVQLWNMANRSKASISITGDSLHEVFSRFTSIVLSAMGKEEGEE